MEDDIFMARCAVSEGQSKKDICRTSIPNEQNGPAAQFLTRELRWEQRSTFIKRHILDLWVPDEYCLATSARSEVPALSGTRLQRSFAAVGHAVAMCSLYCWRITHELRSPPLLQYP